MRTVGVIPARWGSTRLPGKSLVMICGKPLIQWVVERVKQARRLDQVLVATDDARIAEAVKPTGVQTVMTRADHVSGTDRIAEAVQGIDGDVVVNVQGDEPLIDPRLIDRLAETMAADVSWDMGTAVSPILSEKDRDNPSVVKVVFGAEHQALYFSRSVIPFVRDADLGDEVQVYWRHIGLYAYRRPFLDRFVKTPPCLLERAEKLEQLRALAMGGRIVVLETGEAGAGVDTPEDVGTVEGLLRKGR